MAIDRIGKGGGVQPPAELPKAEPKGAFKVERAGHVDPSASVGAGGAASSTGAQAAGEASRVDALSRLKAGEIDVDSYMDLKVDEATSHLKGLAPHELEAIKRVLRDQMASDPGLSDLVRAATGQAPKTPED